MSSATFKQHFDMISMHEPVQNKARFWTSYVGALKGTQDMRADDSSRRRPRPMSEKTLTSSPGFSMSHPATLLTQYPGSMPPATAINPSPGTLTDTLHGPSTQHPKDPADS